VPDAAGPRLVSNEIDFDVTDDTLSSAPVLKRRADA
jgi:hypothetical protein